MFTKVFIDFFTETLKQSGYDPTITSIFSQPADRPNGTPVDWLRVESQQAILIDCPTLLRSPLFKQKSPDLKRVFGEDSEDGPLSADHCDCVLQSLGLAVHTLCYNAVYKTETKNEFFKADSDNAVENRQLPSYIAGRVINHLPFTSLRKLRAHHLGRFISVKGIVVRVGQVDPVCHRLAFECAQCGTKQILILPADGRYCVPTKCSTRGCRSRSFEPLLNHCDTMTIDTQMITIQEACEDEADDGRGNTENTAISSLGRNPRCLGCRLSRDLADSCIPGDVVHLTGVVSLLNADGVAPGISSSWYGRRGSNVFSLVLEVNSVVRVSGSGPASAASLRCSGASASVSDGNRGLLIITSSENLDNDREDKVSGQVISNLDSDFSIKDLYAIREISEQPHLFRLLVASLCPTICGRGLVKAGLLLALFGGTQSRNRRRRVSRRHKNKQRERSPSPTQAGVSYRIDVNTVSAVTHEADRDFNLSDGSSSSSEADENEEVSPEVSDPGDDFGPRRRAASHVLVVGDPGLGKSQMLRATASLAPRVIYVCGNTATAAGLTVSTIREGSGNGGGFGLEAGALVLADQGCCCIDEFDKLACDPAVLLEAMEQQTISVARGGLVANLPARAAVLAAANPVGGHYDSTRTLEENLRIPPALLSRFDLVFVLLDRPDETADRLLSEHVTAVHTGSWKPSSFVCTPASQPGSDRTPRPHISAVDIDPQAPLAQRLEIRVGERVDYIPSVLLRKYILYARKYVMPSLSTAAAMTLRDFYLELRRNRHERDTFPVTVRQLESLVRLTEARARAELREEATKEDALDVCQLMRATGLGTGHVGGTPANATLSEIAKSIPVSRRATSDSGPAAAKRLLAALELAARNSNSRLFTRAEIQTLVTGLSLSAGSVDPLINRLNDSGALLKQGPTLYKLI
ncbi:DNA replication licensing factor mcm8 [Clonorchis sinensis]|uniref:DNA helicase MCM8 n=1 Tax=Clonorchis sinensis TaxID=79923 RepID=A0A8T1MM16_CLOSI|nr:DNA replication licensing factor mcm8 [Clonorchis sinensis]